VVQDAVPQHPKNENGKKQPPAHVSMNTNVVRQEQFVIELWSWQQDVHAGTHDTQQLHGS